MNFGGRHYVLKKPVVSTGTKNVPMSQDCDMLPVSVLLAGVSGLTQSKAYPPETRTPPLGPGKIRHPDQGGSMQSRSYSHMLSKYLLFHL